MNDLFKTDINFPVLGVSCLPFITLLPIAIGTELQLLKVCASVAENKNWIHRLARHWTGR